MAQDAKITIPKIKHPVVDQPGLLVQLYKHQLTSIYHMEAMEKNKSVDNKNNIVNTQVGVFADLPGYGKSLSMVGLIVRDEMEWDMKSKYAIVDDTYNGPWGTYYIRKQTYIERYNCTLLVVPNTLVHQWTAEFDRAPQLNYFVIQSKKNLEVNPHDYDVIICSSTMYNVFVSYHIQKAWKRFVFDEAASTKIPGMIYAYAGFTWYVTATYKDLTYIKGRARHAVANIFYRIYDEHLEMLTVKNSEDYCKESFKVPLPKEVIHYCKDSGLLKVVSNLIGAKAKEMIAAGDIQGAIQALGGKSSTNIIELVQNKKKEELLEAEQKVLKWKSKFALDKTAEKTLKKWQDDVKSIKSQLQSLADKYTEFLSGDCMICMDPISNPVSVPCCQVVMCGKCITTLLAQGAGCPHCRMPLVATTLTYIKHKSNNNDDDEKEENDEKKSIKDGMVSKQQTIVRILTRRPETAKFIIFSNYDESFNSICAELKTHKIEYVQIKGNYSTREKRLKEYQSGKVNVLILNSRFNGAGINLEMTTDVILYHQMTKTIETQVVGRVGRIGKIGEFFVHRLKGMSEDFEDDPEYQNVDLDNLEYEEVKDEAKEAKEEILYRDNNGYDEKFCKHQYPHDLYQQIKYCGHYKSQPYNYCLTHLPLHQCKYIITSGTKTGQKCNKATTYNYNYLTTSYIYIEYCSTHLYKVKAEEDQKNQTCKHENVGVNGSCDTKCNNTVVPKQKYCQTHLKLQGCQHHMKTGPRKGAFCGKSIWVKKYCYTHYKKYTNEDEKKEEKNDNNNDEEKKESTVKKCIHTFFKGKNMGNYCGKGCLPNKQYCMTHYKSQDVDEYEDEYEDEDEYESEDEYYSGEDEVDYEYKDDE